MQILEYGPFKASEQPILQKIERVLTNDPSVSLLVGPDGEIIELPRSVFRIVKQVIYHMMHGQTIFVISEEQVLTTQEAANILGTSRPYIIKLLEDGKIPFTKVGVHRRIRASDLTKYQKQTREEQKRAIDKVAQLSQDLGLYD